MCVGAMPPFDHPHVFLDMGDDDEIICPYCSTLYRHDPGARCPRGAAGGMRADRSGLTASGAHVRGALAHRHHCRRRHRRADRGAGVGAARIPRRRCSIRPQRLEETGAGIQLSPNASRVLIALGLGAALRHVVAPEELGVMDAQTARILAALRSATCRRAALRRALLGDPSRRPAGRARRSGARQPRYFPSSRRRGRRLRGAWRGVTVSAHSSADISSKAGSRSSAPTDCGRFCAAAWAIG